MRLEFDKAVLPAERNFFVSYQHVLYHRVFGYSSGKGILSWPLDLMLKHKLVGKKTHRIASLRNQASCMRARNRFGERPPFHIGTKLSQTPDKFFRASRSTPEKFMVLDQDGGLTEKQGHGKD